MSLFKNHRVDIERALEAVRKREFYEQFPEHPSAYDNEAILASIAVFESSNNKHFEGLLQAEPLQWSGEENSPFSRKDLGILYPTFLVDDLLERSLQAFSSWKKTSVDSRAGILMESLRRVERRFGEIAQSTLHTTGQSFMMSFQASGPHAADRAIEALAMAYQELNRFPSAVDWNKQAGRMQFRLEKEFLPIPKGVALVIGCSTFPSWNSTPGIFANLMTGNPVIVKPHPAAVYPVAVYVAEIQAVLKEEGLDPQTIQLAVDLSKNPLTKKLAEHPSVKIIDYTGSSEFGNYIEALPGKITFTEKSAINSVIIDSGNDLREIMRNLAFSLCLYSGQMCTAPQNFFIPETGVKGKDGEVISYAQVLDLLQNEVSALVLNPKMGAGVLGALNKESTLQTAKDALELGGESVLESAHIENPDFPKARIYPPRIIEVSADQPELFSREFFGPVALIVKTKNTQESIALAAKLAQEKGAITCAAYTSDESTKAEIKEAMNSVFVPVTFNLIGYIWVNQHATYSDFHGTGGNAAGNASFSDASFVNRRFVWVGNRSLAR